MSSNKGDWGRSVTPDISSLLTTIGLLLFAPIITLCFNNANLYYNGSLTDLIKDTLIFPSYDQQITIALLQWIGFQLGLAVLPDVLHYILPSYKGGVQTGQITPAGHELKYNINGLQAWLITHIGFYLAAFHYKIISPTLIADHWGPMLVSANLIAYVMSILVLIKAYVWPTYPRDNKTTAYFFYDYFWGIEFNPRILCIDFKLFFNGRPGIIAWTLINISFAAKQYQQYGGVSDSMIVVNILQALYVLDFFWNENWYLKTIDIAHDHFGWYLAWGDLVWLPFMYTLQSAYLANNPVQLGTKVSAAILGVGLFGYIIFRWTNYQKDYFRRHLNKATIWGKRAKYIICKFMTKDEQEHYSYLLLSGFWGWARHMNYTGDLILSLCYCLACGRNHVLPYFYFVYMTLLLISRCYRDEHRCSHKYGFYWQQYCREVKARLIPFIY